MTESTHGTVNTASTMDGSQRRLSETNELRERIVSALHVLNGGITIKSLTTECDGLRAALASAKRESETETDKLRRRVNELEADLKDFDARNTWLRGENNELKGTITSLRSDNHALRASLTKWEAQNLDTKRMDEINALKAEVERLTAQNTCLENCAREMHDHYVLNRGMSDLSALKAEVEMLRTVYADAMAQNGNLLSRERGLKEQVAKLETENHGMKCEVRDMKTAAYQSAPPPGSFLGFAHTNSRGYGVGTDGGYVGIEPVSALFPSLAAADNCARRVATPPWDIVAVYKVM